MQQPIESRFDKTSTASQVLEGVDLTGRYALVTGATGGVGKETARALAAAGARVEDLAAPVAGPALKGVIHSLAAKNAQLLAISRPFARGIGDTRLALEVDLIQTLAEDLNAKLMRRDPLSEPVHHSKFDVARLFLGRLPAFAVGRLVGRQ